jgi:hypothetical protein
MLELAGKRAIDEGVARPSVRRFRRALLLNRDLRLDGALATQDGKVFFWEQWGDNLLCLSDSSGAECGLEILRAGENESSGTPLTPGSKPAFPGR